ncbi:PREDICTED: uncharacterized protein LOC109170148 isoform X2 [Ipomoea nil]|uniref:uncharacterized protein LOC109170148 isoform X2 n=1 Tax=Ipomoea nil TaxID=35883 RepID=UPI0009010725|nr:PREDICTED: uncharacterized protein LOC109170148 isoform X2 [Ipomoea nil]
MDPFHHRQRYVQRPPPPNFPDSPNCFHHRPPPPPPHPNLHPPLPPPRHYHHRLPPPPPPRRFSFHPENPQFFDFVKNRDSPPTPHSIPTLEPWSDLSPRFPPSQPLHHRQTPFLLPLNEQTDNSRFIRDDRVIKNNGFGDNRSITNQDSLWGRKDSDFDDEDNVDKFRFKSGFQRPSIQHRLHIRDDREEDLRWGYPDVNDVLDSSSRRLSLDNSSYGYDQRRFSSRVREGVEEFRRSPRNKYMQKRSAPLRIQLGKTNNRIRNQDRHYSRGFVDNSSVAGSRGKEKDGNARAGKRVEERESSPVELDVSFKSNALVAKAIVAPSSPALESDKNLTPRVPKARRLRMSGSPSEDFGKCENSANGSDFPLNSEKDSRELEDNVSGNEKASTSINNACTPTKNMVSDRGTNGIGNDESPLRKTRYKKKVMTSVMEKTSLLQKESGANPVSADRSSNNPSSVSQLDDDTIHAEERIVSHGMNKVQDFVLAHSSNEEPVTNKIHESSEPVDSARDDSSRPFNSKRKRTCLSVIAVSKSQVDTEINEHAHPESRSLENYPLFNSETSIVEPQKSPTGSSIDKEHDYKEKPCQNADLMIETNLVQESTGHMLSIENNGCAHISSSEETMIHKDGMNVLSVTADACAASESLLRFSKSPENVIDVGYLHAGSEQLFINSLTIPHTDGISKEPPDSFFLVRDVSNACSLSAEKTIVHQGLSSVSCSNPCSSTSTNSNVSGPCTGIISVSQSCFPNDIIRKSGADGSIASPDIGCCNVSPLPSIGVEDCHDLCLGREYSLEANRKRKARDIQLNFSSPRTSDTPINLCSPLDLSKGMNCVKEYKVTAPENGDNSSYRGQSHEGSSGNDISVRGGLETGSYVTTPKNLKKRKCSPALGHTILSETFEGLDEANMSEPPTQELSIGNNAITCTVSQVENCCAALSPCIQPMVTLHDNSTNPGSFLGESVGDGFLGDLSKLEQVPSFPSHMGAGEKESTSVVSKGNDQDDPLGMATKICEEKFTSSMDGMVPTEGDSECRNGLSTSNFSDEMTGPIPDSSTIKSSPFQVSNEVDSEVEPTDNELMVSSGDALSFSVKTSSDNSKVDGYAVNAISTNHLMKITASPSPPDSYKPSTVSISSSLPDTFKPPQSLKSVPSKSILSKDKMSSVLPRGYSGSSSVSFITSRKAALPTHVAKPRTWHRTGNSSSVTGSVSIVSSIPPRSQSPNDTMNIRNSYIRKGNSLVRNLSHTGTVARYHASSSSVYRLNSSSIKGGKKFKSDNVVDASDPSSCTKTSGSNTLSQRLNCKPLNCTSNNLGNPMPLPVADQSGSGSLGRELNGLELTAVMSVQKCSEDAAKSFQCLADSVNKLETQNTSDEGNSRKKLLYLKRRSNQLVAAPDTTPTSSSDGYYKRRKNQLVRTITENHVKQGVAVVDDGLNSERQVAEKAITKKQTVLPNAHNRSKFSLVWTLNGTQSSREDGSSFNHKVRPYMFPWKRATNLRSFVQSLGSIPNDHSISTIRQRLLLSRKRDTVYTRSAYGLSLRRSKVLSVCGASLKWSKSIERNSRKANQEATLAVAAAEKRKRGQNSIAPSNSNRRNNVSRERIFRIGSERYKMDPTGKTLQRISSDEELAEDVPQSESNAKTSYIPRRLLIGNDEYVRIGNGNKLVRNPKRRVRILANQKVRWSLHTARLRLAKKKKYCQFFTRFGKCNKDNGKCPYIHDPSKIAVCTKFLSGSCSNLDCKLTHKVIPERMQDCSYFLQGLCSNESCPYRHVNVNPNSSVCEGFLRGYCSDGNECRKKHTYVCPDFEATGNCLQGSKCKLHHPKNRRKGIRRGGALACNEKKNDRGRYFGSPHIDISECIRAVSEDKSSDEDFFFKEGRFVEFIRLDANVEEQQIIDQSNVERCEEGGPLHLQIAAAAVDDDDFDELIKPIRLINHGNRTTAVDSSSTGTGSPSEMSTSYDVSEESHSQCCKNEAL